MRPTKEYFLVEINLQEQEDRKVLIPGTDIKIADTVADFKYYLQAAPIIAIGEKAKSYFPEAEVGDFLIFHHTVEFDEWRHIGHRVVSGLPVSVAEKKDVFQQILVRADIDDVFGIQKINTLEIIPSPEHVWCQEIKEETTFSVTVKDEFGKDKTILAFATDNEATLRARIEELQNQAEFISTGRVSDKSVIMEIKREQESITKELNKPRAFPLKAAIVHPSTMERLSIENGDIVLSNGWMGYKGYPISVQDLHYQNGELKKKGATTEYLLVRSKFLLAIKK